MSTASPSQLTTLLANDVLARVERLRINPLRRRTNRMRGEHLSGKGGTSIEFSDYREYAVGDDMRYVDWNIFSRLNHPYLKLYAHEEEMHVLMLLDSSSSMDFEGKFELARQIVASIAVMGLMGVEKVSIYACGSRQQGPVKLAPCSGRVNLKRLFRFLEGIKPGGDFTVEAAIEDVLKEHRGKGVAYVVSDFLTFGDVGRSFNVLHGAGLEIHGIQILSPSERDPELTGDLRFVDSETDETLDISSVGELLGLYHEHLEALERYLASECRRRSGRFLTVGTDDR